MLLGTPLAIKTFGERIHRRHYYKKLGNVYEVN